ncbi:MAG: hypothetical protein AB8G17_05345 [Gammaproteobacteria bacterium]
MSVFGHQFEQNHIHVLEGGQVWQAAQLRKIAAERFLGRGDTTNSLIFFTENELREFEAFVGGSVPRGRTYSHDKPLRLRYPNDSFYMSKQQITAVVTVSKRDRPDLRMYQAHTVREGINVGNRPSITFLYGQIGNAADRSYRVFHFDDVTYGSVPQHFPFSLNQVRALNQAATVHGTDEAWIQPLFAGI